MSSLRLVLCLGFFLAGLFRGRAAHPEEEPLCTAHQVRTLSPEDADRMHPVQLHGIVTYYDPDRYHASFQDETGGIYFACGGTVSGNALPIHMGDLVELDGVTAAGCYAPIVIGRPVAGGGERPVAARVLGRGNFPEPRPVGTDFLEFANHNRFVSVRGVICSVEWEVESDPAAFRFETSRLRLEISTPAGRIFGSIPGLKPSEVRLPKEWVNAEAEIDGVLMAVSNDRRQLVQAELAIPNMQFVKPDFEGTASYFAQPVRGFETLLSFDPRVDTNRRVHVRGVVTMRRPREGIYLRGEEGGLWVATAQRDPMVSPGDLVDAAGFTDTINRRPTLREALVKVARSGGSVAPVRARMEDLGTDRLCDEYISVEGMVLDHYVEKDQPGGGGYDVIFLQNGDTQFYARTLRSTPGAKAFPQGSWVRVDGICQFDHFKVRPNHPTLPTSFHLLVPSLADAQLLRSPGWMTPARLRGLLLALATTLLVAGAWLVLLRAQVARQTRVIQEKVARETLLRERARMARELHDTLEQHLAGIKMQLDAASDALFGSPELASKRLSTARDMLRHSQSEARRSVRELRSELLERLGLHGMFHDLAKKLSGGPAEIVVEAPERGPALDPMTELYLYRVGQEAVANAIKHSQATKITLRLEHLAECSRLTIQDNGVGFSESEVAKRRTTHFGLLGMKERASKLNGKLRIESAPGRGATVTLEVARPPAPEQARPANVPAPVAPEMLPA